MRQDLIYAAVVVAVILVTLCFTGLIERPKGDGKVIVEVWEPWGTISGTSPTRELIDGFAAAQDRIEVKTVYNPGMASGNQKFFLAVAAGAPPDVTFVDGTQVTEWAARGALEPIEDLVEEAGLGPDDFWEPCWKQCMYKGHIYAMTFCVDPNFAFAWNKDVFREVGLDPERPPRTLSELDEYAEKIFAFDKTGRMTRIGFVPWWTGFINANALYTWGWAFGGRFYDPETDRITCDDPKIVEALEWMLSYKDKYGITSINSLREGFGTGAEDPFFTGLIGLSFAHTSTIINAKQYAPDLDYGLSPFPTPEPGMADQSTWVGGWCVGIPKGARHKREAFEFIKWLCTSDEAGMTLITRSAQFTGYKKSAALDAAAKDPKLRVMLEVLEHAKHQRPVIPVQAFYFEAMNNAVEYALFDQMTPKEALSWARERTQKELERIRKRERKQ